MKKHLLSKMTSGLIILISLLSCQNESSKKVDQKLTSEEIIDIASKVYGYPLVLMEYTKRSMTNVSEPNSVGNAPVNQIGHLRAFPDHTFTDVVKPNVDTYYSLAWMDLVAEPLVLSVPQSERYCSRAEQIKEVPNQEYPKNNYSSLDDFFGIPSVSG